ncbi:hypothetical protein SAMN04487949_0081 [Halogranum gelatinilyticum]|uniref:DUF8107 domain-containing protein n=1 Tax=Halogranum gelatinilyticum TaxID=660521 RepID=A0A1G9NRD3_9EURY|nr:hypothetical protein [Halogranum gelatinilyticum]SDL89166.1 hypothetical protein SAMN04487949_0081 [Halogranum gelatinilyticum]
MANSQGDPRVLFVMNLVLSSVFAWVIVWGLNFIGVLAFSARNVAVAAALLMVLTHFVTR